MINDIIKYSLISEKIIGENKYQAFRNNDNPKDVYVTLNNEVIVLEKDFKLFWKDLK